VHDVNGLNLRFLAGPAAFLGSYTVDNKTCQQGNQAALDITTLNIAKLGSFDFQRSGFTGPVMFRPVRGATMVEAYKSDGAIAAYWCPFLAGGNLPGYVDIPRQAPKYKLILTAAMQGCAFVACEGPTAAEFRVYHNQHPGTQAVEYAIDQASPVRISSLDYADYAVESEEATNAFNLMYLTDEGHWVFLSQSNLIVPGRGHAIKVASSGSPIVEKAANVP